MKKIIKFIILLVIIVFMIIGIIFYYKQNYSKVTVYVNDIDKVKIYNVRNGKTLKNLENPNMDGYAFLGWYYLDSNEEFTLEEAITKDITIVAKWAKINIE